MWVGSTSTEVECWMVQLGVEPKAPNDQVE